MKKTKPHDYDVQFKKLISQRYRNRIPEGFKCVAEISTAHMTAADAAIWTVGGDFPGFLGCYEYGWFFKTTDDLAILDTYRDNGLSSEFISIIRRLFEGGINYVCFDQDGPVVDEFKKFDW